MTIPWNLFCVFALEFFSSPFGPSGFLHRTLLYSGIIYSFFSNKKGREYFGALPGENRRPVCSNFFFSHFESLSRKHEKCRFEVDHCRRIGKRRLIRNRERAILSVSPEKFRFLSYFLLVLNEYEVCWILV